MRKTSQDGGDATSITSGFENEVKKSGTGITKIKRNSIKKKVFSHDSDDGVIEPLLQKEKEKPEFPNQSAKYSISKTKTDSINEKSDDRDMLLPENDIEKPTFSSFSVTNGTKDAYKPYVCSANTIHNHMNANVFSSTDGIKSPMLPKTQVLIEIDGRKQGSYTSGPLIFTTAKIHTDGKTTHMEPVQVTPVPILSTVEGSVVKTSSISDNEKKALGTAYGTSNNVISNVEFGKSGLASSSMPCKIEPVICGVSKIKAEERHVSALSNKVVTSNSPTDSKTSNTLNSASKINDIVVNKKEKDYTPTLTTKSGVGTSEKPQTVKELPKPTGDGKNIITFPEIDFNKNFQAGPSQINITMPSSTSMLTKDTKSTNKFNTPTPIATSSKSATPSVLPTIASGSVIKSNDKSALDHISDTGSVITSTLSKAAPVTSSIQTSAKIEPKRNSVKTLTSNATSKGTYIPINKDILKHEEKVTKQLPITATTILSCKTQISSIKAPNTTVGTTSDKLLTSSSKPTNLITSSVTPTCVKSPVSTTSASIVKTASAATTSITKTTTTASPGITPTTIYSTAKSQLPTISASITSSEKSSTFTSKPISTKTTVQSTVASSSIKSSVATSKGVSTTASKSVLSASKPIAALASSTPTTAGFSVKSSASVTNSTSQPAATTVTKKSTAPLISANTLPSTSIIPTANVVSSKISKPKDVASDNKTRSAVTSVSLSTKPLAVTVSATAQITPISQATSITPKPVVSSEKPGNVGIKTSSTAGSAKVTQAPLSKPSGSQTNSKPATVSSIVSSSSQVIKPAVIIKPNELQNNEHKKEKLK